MCVTNTTGRSRSGELNEVPQALRGLESEDALELVDRARHARAEGEDDVVGSGVDVRLEEPVRLVVGERHRRAGGARLGVRVADEGAERVEQPRLDGTVQSPARRPVGVDDPLLAIRRLEGLVPSDGVPAERLEVLLQVVHAGLLPADAPKIAPSRAAGPDWCAMGVGPPAKGLAARWTGSVTSRCPAPWPLRRSTPVQPCPPDI